jgi:hypothetical protein
MKMPDFAVVEVRAGDPTVYRRTGPTDEEERPDGLFYRRVTDSAPGARLVKVELESSDSAFSGHQEEMDTAILGKVRSQ